MQWWEPEMTEGSLAKIVSEFEATHPNIKIKLISKPYSDVESQVTIAAATGTMSDVVGLNPKWAYNLASQGSLLSFNQFFGKDDFDQSKIDVTKVKGEPYVISLEGFIYPLFYNVSHFEKAGITKVPDTWSEFKDAASKLSTISSNSQPLAVGLSMQKPSNVQNDVFAWFWAQDGTAIPTINTPENIEVMKYWASLYKAGYMNPGALVAAEQDKIELFTNERVSMMVDSLAHLNMLKERNPDLKFDIAPVPVKDGYTGRRAMLGSAWGLGISKYTKHPQESWEFVKFLLSADIDGRIADNCNAFPINKDATVSWVNSNELNKKAFTLYQKMGMKNESYGAPEANRLYLIFDEQFQLALNGDQTMEEAAAKIQSGWDEVYQKAESGK
jgi:multiple sugar transport system substrate-binding protein